MSSSIVHTQTPEERELAAKQEDLDALEADLAQQEVELATLATELQAFEFRYMQMVGVKMAEMDTLEAAQAEAEATRKPKDKRAQRAAEEARAQAEESNATAQGIVDAPAPIVPTPELKLLFREVARSIHPDLSADDKELPQRTRLMAQANQAYRRGDDDGLRQILEEWHSAPEAIRGTGVGVDLVRVIRRIAQVERRLAQIGEEMDTLEYSDLFQLYLEVEDAQAEGVDLLAEMAAEIEKRIRAVRSRVQESAR
jgi:multidrug efflux pump subunit AcrA (membrane-fusion protein)